MEKKSNMKFSGIKKMLTKDQLKSVVGGYGGGGTATIGCVNNCAPYSAGCYQVACGGQQTYWMRY